MPTRREQIKSKAVEILKGDSQGVRYSPLVRMLKEAFPDIPSKTIHGTVWNLGVTLSREVYKPERGLFRHTSFKDTEVPTEGVPITPTGTEINEEEFYQPFANHLEGSGVCTKAIKLGGSRFGGRWGTPDVIGVWKTLPSDPIKGTIIVSAEIKYDPSASGLIAAFGQACAYKIFSHQVYLVIPKDSRNEDQDRLESLCLIFGIGLILFDRTNHDEPGFEIKVSPLKHEPDLYYVNKYMKIIENELPC